MSPKYIVALVALLLWAGSVGLAFWQGGLSARKDAAEERAAQLSALVAETLEAEARAATAELGLAKKLRAVQAPAPRLETIIRENPSSCSAPQPVLDGLQDAIDAANAHIRSTL